MSEHAQLKAEPRQLIGKKVRRLRKEGILPATIYGHNVTPVNIQLDAHEFGAVLRHSGRTQLIDLEVDGSKRPVFVKQMAVDAKRHIIQHVEFYQANLREPVTTVVPLHYVGESAAVRDGGIFLTVLDRLSIESLPDAVPAAGIEVDQGLISEINGILHAGQIPLPSGVTLLTNAEEVVAKVDPPASEESLEAAVADTEPLPKELGGDETPADAVPTA